MRDLSSIEALKSAPLDARTVAYTKSAIGVHCERVLQRPGIAEEVKAKAVLRVGGVAVAWAVASGDAELGLTVIGNIVLTRGTDAASLLPDEIHHYADFSAVVSADAKEPVAAKAFFESLSAPTAPGVLRSKGMEHGVPK